MLLPRAGHRHATLPRPRRRGWEIDDGTALSQQWLPLRPTSENPLRENQIGGVQRGVVFHVRRRPSAIWVVDRGVSLTPRPCGGDRTCNRVDPRGSSVCAWHVEPGTPTVAALVVRWVPITLRARVVSNARSRPPRPGRRDLPPPTFTADAHDDCPSCPGFPVSRRGDCGATPALRAVTADVAVTPSAILHVVRRA